MTPKEIRAALKKANADFYKYSDFAMLSGAYRKIIEAILKDRKKQKPLSP